MVKALAFRVHGAGSIPGLGGEEKNCAEFCSEPITAWGRCGISLQWCRDDGFRSHWGGQCGVVTARGRAWKQREEECNGNSVTVICKRLKLSANWPVGLLAQWLRCWPFASTARVRSPAWAERKKIVRSSAVNPSRPGDVVEFRYNGFINGVLACKLKVYY